jgi:ADP-heptose:LPS heptosyltransferase
LRVGLIWAASDWDRTRSIPLHALAPLGGVPGIRFYSLQQGEQAAASAHAPFAIEPYSTHTGEIVAAAAAMLELDLVITVDAMAAHLAGALGRPVWVLLKHEADWRWMDAVPTSPWYPTMRLFRQARAGDWTSVAHDVAHALGRRVAAR